MRKYFAIALVSCLTLGATAMYAQATASTSASATKTTTTKTTTATTATSKAHKVSGDVSKLDCTAKTLTVGTTDLNINDKTHITKAKKKAACTDLKDGDKATASYTTDKDGKNWAKYISVP
jgi:hypothetical protein